MKKPKTREQRRRAQKRGWRARHRKPSDKRVLRHEVVREILDPIVTTFVSPPPDHKPGLVKKVVNRLFRRKV